jgi:NAD(P)-dependent dehydrogenase (short-subunit alcohol dehydrogenase family)
MITKTALNMLGGLYGVKFAERGWKVNLVCPGLRKTKLNDFMEGASDPSLGAIEAVALAMDESSIEEGGRSGGLWDWDGASVPW